MRRGSRPVDSVLRMTWNLIRDEHLIARQYFVWLMCYVLGKSGLEPHLAISKLVPFLLLFPGVEIMGRHIECGSSTAAARLKQSVSENIPIFGAVQLLSRSCSRVKCQYYSRIHLLRPTLLVTDTRVVALCRDLG
jgi:hypothetical protein